MSAASDGFVFTYFAEDHARLDQALAVALQSTDYHEWSLRTGKCRIQSHCWQELGQLRIFRSDNQCNGDLQSRVLEILVAS